MVRSLSWGPREGEEDSEEETKEFSLRKSHEWDKVTDVDCLRC